MHHQCIAGDFDNPAGCKGGFDAGQIRAKQLFQFCVVDVASGNHNNSSGSPLIKKDCTKSASLLTTMRPSCLALAMTSWSGVRFLRGRSSVCNESCPASFSQMAKRRGSCALTRNFMQPNVPTVYCAS